MNLRRLLPTGKISDDTIRLLNPIFEAEALYKRQHYSEAEKKYQQALKAFPPGSGGRFLVYNKLGIIYEEIKDFNQAIEVYKRCIGEGTITPFTYQRLVCLCLDSGKLKEAFEYCNKGIKCLKRARTNLVQEIYFWFKFQRLRWKIKRLYTRY